MDKIIDTVIEWQRVTTPYVIALTLGAFLILTPLFLYKIWRACEEQNRWLKAEEEIDEIGKG